LKPSSSYCSVLIPVVPNDQLAIPIESQKEQHKLSNHRCCFCDGLISEVQNSSSSFSSFSCLKSVKHYFYFNSALKEFFHISLLKSKKGFEKKFSFSAIPFTVFSGFFF
jgi:hypothetical protein